MEASGALSVPLGPDNNFEMDTEAYDNGGMYAAPNDFITITQAGVYSIVGAIQFDATAAQRQVRIVIDGDVKAITVDRGANAQQTLQVVTSLRLVAGDQVTLGTFSSSAVAVSNFTGLNDAWLSVQWVGP